MLGGVVRRVEEIRSDEKSRIGIEDCLVTKGGRKLRCGYTTGTCAAAAAKGAVFLLFGNHPESVELKTPKGILLRLPLESREIRKNESSVYAVCGVRKDAGDDPDVTDGLLICAKVGKTSRPGIFLDGGEGVGRVTLPGLPCPAGQAAINPVPAQMIRQEAAEAASFFGYEGGLEIQIFVPGGEMAAKKTFNPGLGIVGGISILGTTGIVEPMSEKALIDTIGVEIRQHAALGERFIIAVPGNYGEIYLKEKTDLPPCFVKCSNYIGETIELAEQEEIKGILFVAHIGKFVKVGAGIMNTHSRAADGRMEVLCACAVRAGAGIETARDLLKANTTEEALQILQEAGILQEAMADLMERIRYYLNRNTDGKIVLEAIVFSNVFGYLGETSGAETLRERIREQNLIL